VNTELHQKVTPSHLKRAAYLYVRQSTLRQVMENTESTKRQYALRDRAVALGWPVERIVVIDSDLGQSAASAVDREGFQKLVAEVGLGHVGIVLGLEVSRLARSSADWHRLLEICALTDTLILDEDGVYDPGHFNDRLLLGLKGTMSEAELHVLAARLRGGVLSKARRGELKLPLPVGLIYTPDDRVVLDPDQQVQQAVHLFFATFRRTGSAWRTVRAFREQELLFPRRVRKGPRRGELVWAPLLLSNALHILHNPRYAGAFFFGRQRTRKTVDGGTHTELLPREQWIACFPGAHPGYITWADYEENLRRLSANAQAHGPDRRISPPREGPALLQGLVVCGLCGSRMTVRYHRRGGQLVPDYVCQRACIEHGAPVCQIVPGAGVDQAVGALLLEAVTPLALEVALAVQDEIRSRAEEADRLRRQQVERARYEADLAQRRFMHVDPDNRLVADVLEAEWNQKLRDLADAQQIYEQQRARDHLGVDDAARTEIQALATDFPRLWHDPRTTDRERKRLVRHIVEDVTLLRGDRITAHVRFKGGAARTLSLPLPLPATQLRKNDSEVVQLVDRLLNHHTEAEVAALLNERGLRTIEGKPFHHLNIRHIRLAYGLPDRFTRLRARGLLTLNEIADALRVHRTTVLVWRRRGLLRAYPYTERGDYLFEPPAMDAPVKYKWKLPRPHRPPAKHCP
jgi:DNA invertase Pin-like site-specific DNA recombinase